MKGFPMRCNTILSLAAGLLAALLLLLPGPALAHKVNVFAYLEDGALKGEGYFGGGSKAMNCPVKLLDAGGKLLAQGTTDKEGAFSLPLPSPLPRSAAPLTVVLEAGEGHQAEYQVTAQDLGMSDQPATQPDAQSDAQTPAASPAPAAAQPAVSALSAAQIETAVTKAVASQLGPIKAQLARLADKDAVSLRDVVGGLGWILGLVGVLAWAKARRS